MPMTTKNVIIHKSTPGTRKAREQERTYQEERRRAENDRRQVAVWRKFVAGEKRKERDG